MQARWGIAWLLAVIWLLMLLCSPLPGWASADPGDTWAGKYRLPYLFTASSSPMETQMLGEKPFQAKPSLPAGPSLLPDITPSFQIGPDGGATIKLPRNLEMRISFLYKPEAGAGEPQHLGPSPLMAKYSMDYRLLPNLQVGLNSYLYRRTEEGFPFQRAMSNRAVGYGSELKYDLGNWSFLLKSQIEPGSRDQHEGLQNWFRVWYAF